tara:strand:- start:58 stop:654 length:597 start_codon:yes stop_codon:yes gene_type:complete
MDELIMEIPGAATPEFCQMMIDKFELDERKGSSRIGPDAAEDKKIRDSTNLEMNLLADWKPVVDDLRGMIYSRLTKYIDEIHIGTTMSLFESGYDSSYTLMKYVPGSVGYTWHNDFVFDTFSNNGGCRTVTWLFYLNECEGGETDFKYGRKVVPETGKLVFFPSCWSMVHRGLPVISGVKYLCVGWIHSTWNKGLDKR